MQMLSLKVPKKGKNDAVPIKQPIKQPIKHSRKVLSIFDGCVRIEKFPGKQMIAHVLSVCAMFATSI